MHRGTGGDFVRTFGIPHKLDAALDVARGTTTRTVDLGRATYRTWDGGEETKWFANAGKRGHERRGRQARERDRQGARRQGLVRLEHGGRLRALAERGGHGQGRRRGAERPDVRRDVANGRYLGGGMKITPDAEPDDGAFDVLLIGDISKGDLMVNLPKIYRGTHLPHPKAELLRGSHVTIDAPIPLPVQLDGEQPGTTPATFEVVPRALRLRVP